VMSVLDCSVPDAAVWLADQFDVPTIPKGGHLPRSLRQLREVGSQGPQSLLIRTGIWARLPEPARRMVPVFLEFAGRIENQTARVHMSYRGLRRFTGLNSDASVRKGILALEQMGWLRREGARRETGSIIRTAGTYVLTPWSDGVMALGNSLMREEREAIECERELRKRAREHRRANYASRCVA
jgi:hypothetical protein